jgi:hypothetical protein
VTLKPVARILSPRPNNILGIWFSRIRLQEGNRISAATAQSKSKPIIFVKRTNGKKYFAKLP